MSFLTDKAGPFVYDEWDLRNRGLYSENGTFSPPERSSEPALPLTVKQIRDEEVKEWRRKINSYAWYQNNLKIRDKQTHRLIMMALNPIQEDLERRFREAEKEKKLARFIILKARQMGCSTWISSKMAHRCFTRKNFSGLIIAHDNDTSSYLFQMLERMYINLPDELRPKGIAKERGKLIELTSGSSVRIETAVDAEAGRGLAALWLHCSEVAFWRDPIRTLLALRQIIPEELGTAIFLESTANGVGNHFYTEWKMAEENKTEYIPIFYPWFDFPGYWREVPDIVPRDEDGYITLLDEDEHILRTVHHCSSEQIFWRRMAIKNLAGTDILRFNQEYPSTAEEAFITSGRPYFGASIKHFTAIDARRTGDLAGSCVRGTPIEFVADDSGYLRIYESPQKNVRYVLFADPSGILTDNQFSAFDDITLAHDYCAIQVVNCKTGEQVAQYRAKVDNDIFGLEIFKLAKIYNNAIVAVEMSGGYGLAPMSILHKKLHYPNLYLRQELSTVSGQWTRQLGWMTHVNNRPLMLDALNQTLRDAPDKLKDKDLKKEMIRFIISPSGKPVASPGHNDDLVMSMAGALMLYQEFPQSSKPFSQPAAPVPLE